MGIYSNCKLKGENGFTLVQLVVVIAILGILAAITVPRFMQASKEAKSKTCLSNRIMLVRAFEIAKGEGLATEGGLGDFLNSVEEGGSNYNYFFKDIPRCPSWDGSEEDKYTVVDGNIYCSHHTDDVVNGQVSDSSESSVFSEIEQLIANYLANNDSVSGWDLINAIVDEYGQLPALTDEEVESILTSNGIDTDGKEFYWSADSSTRYDDKSFIMITSGDSNPTENYYNNGKTSTTSTGDYGWASEVYAVIYEGNTYVSNDENGTSVVGWIAMADWKIESNLNTYFTKITDN